MSANPAQLLKTTLQTLATRHPQRATVSSLNPVPARRDPSPPLAVAAVAAVASAAPSWFKIVSNCSTQFFHLYPALPAARTHKATQAPDATTATTNGGPTRAKRHKKKTNEATPRGKHKQSGTRGPRHHRNAHRPPNAAGRN